MLAIEALLDEARRVAGLNDYGSMDFAEGLQVLVDSINTEAGLTPESERGAEKHLLRLLVNRLRMQRDLTRHPEILDEEVLPPVFITSLPRTGSTKLHRMLAATGDFHSMKYWQALEFAPFAETDLTATAPDPRIRAAQEHLDWAGKRSPRFLEGHPMYAEEAEEERLLLNAGFNSLYDHASFFQVPAYVNWVLQRDPRKSFEDLRHMLQYLQWQHFRGHRRRWILKTPSQFGTEGMFADVFKGTDFIATHRHPEHIFASVCALLTGIFGLYYDQDMSDKVGAMMLHAFGQTVQGHLQWRDQYSVDKVFDVAFEDVVGNEFELLSRIYEFLGMHFSVISRANVEAWLKMDAARRTPSGKYTLGEFGLTREQVNERFADYIKRYEKYV